MTTGNESGFLAIYICVCIFFIIYLLFVCYLYLHWSLQNHARPSEHEEKEMNSKIRREKDNLLYSARLLIGVLLFSAVFAILPPQTVQAASTSLYEYTVRVETGYLALRNGQSFNKKNEIGKLYTGQTVIACPTASEKDGYRYVYAPSLNKLGYVNGDYLENRSLYTGGTTLYAKVETGYLALRNAKSFDKSNEIGKLNTGDPVIVLDDSDPVYWIVYAPEISKAGFVNSYYLVNSSFNSAYVEPDVPLAVSPRANAEWRWESDSSDVLDLRVQVSNYSRKKTVTAYELYIFAEDLWGNKVFGDTVKIRATFENTINPGETIYSGHMYLPERKKISRFYAAVKRVKLSDGTICENYILDESDYTYWDIKQ